jgi:hypothetical protein
VSGAAPAAAVRAGFDAGLAGRAAECDGGMAVPGTHLVARAEFAGVLTGEFVDQGDPPWRWLLLADLTRKPEGWPGAAVWCDSGSVFLVDG